MSILYTYMWRHCLIEGYGENNTIEKAIAPLRFSSLYLLKSFIPYYIFIGKMLY